MPKTELQISSGHAGVASPIPPADEAIPGIPQWKRILDVTCVLIALPFLMPVGLVLAAFIKIVSPGPAFFRQKRVGYYGKEFMCVKFRTMKVNSDVTVHQLHLKELMTSNRPTRKLDCGGDSRLIRGGVLLRSMGVDELPQLFNVLWGEMSLVGPRPCTPYEFNLLSPRHKRRCGAPPGLTGLWQVSGKNRTTFTKMIQLDIEYARTKSLGLDLKIMLKTVPALFVQMRDNRLQRKTLSRPAAGPTPLPLRVANR